MKQVNIIEDLNKGIKLEELEKKGDQNDNKRHDHEEDAKDRK